jgi:5-(carboxyamino)imidazole ribonucleotide mutase
VADAPLCARSRNFLEGNVTDSQLSKNDTPVVAILTGSPSDLPVVTKGRDVLDSLDIPNDVRVLSAHRTPRETAEYIAAAEKQGVEVFIACAGMAAHLAGVVAAHTIRPVIGVPIASGALQGVDALLSTVQMPPGVPVATVGVDGAKNAAFLAARIVALTHPEVRERLLAHLQDSKKRYDSPDPSVPGQAAT